MKNIDINQSSQQDVFTPDRQQLERCIKPINDARGIPNDYYIRQESFELEGEHLFNKGWFAVGFGKDLPQAGSVKPVNYFKNPLLLIRSSQDKKIRVFQNVCRHRGMVLIEEPTILKEPFDVPIIHGVTNKLVRLLLLHILVGLDIIITQELIKVNSL